MLRIGICNGNSHIRLKIRKILCQVLRNTEVNYKIMEFGGGDEILVCSDELDILVLDINLPGVSGFEVREQFEKTGKDTVIIYVTCQCDRMREAFGIRVIGFVEADGIEKQLPAVFQSALDQMRRFIILKNGINSKRIAYIRAQNVYSIIVFDDGKQEIMREQLGDLEKELKSVGFVRVHRSYLVNLNYVQKVTSEVIILDKKLPIAIRRRKAVNELYKKYCNNETRQ